MPKLREYQPEDFERLLEIDQECFVEGIAYSEEEMRYFLRLQTATTLVAVQGKHVVGFIIGHMVPSRRRIRCMGRVITIDVAKEAQHSGTGSLLMRAMEEKLRAQGCDYIGLEVAVDNDPALAFYKKHGYSVLKVLPRYYMDSIDGLMMGKKL